MFTAGFFLLLTVQAYTPAVVSGVLAILCVLRWLWETDRPVATEGGRCRRRHHAADLRHRPGTHGWWAMIILLIVIGMIF